MPPYKDGAAGMKRYSENERDDPDGQAIQSLGLIENELARMGSMLQVALWEPEIPPNTGNVARLCAATGCPLHLVGRLGFRIDEKSVRRAGLDYWEHVEIHHHNAMADLEDHLTRQNARLFCLSARVDRLYTQIPCRAGDCLLFGPETRGLPPEVLERYHEHCFGIPMPTGKVRSLNLATSVGIVVYDGLRRLHGW